MNWINPIYYIGIPFAYLFGIIKETNTIRHRVLMTVVGMIFVIAGIVLLIKWHTIPSYTHYIFVERIYSKDSVKDGCYHGYYHVAIDNSKRNNSGDEREFFFFYRRVSSVKGESYKEMKNKRNDNEYNNIKDLLVKEDGLLFDQYFSENKLKLSDYNFGFKTIHAYQDDMNPLFDDTTLSLLMPLRDSINDNISLKGAKLSFISNRPDDIFDFFTSYDTVTFRGIQYDNIYATLSFDAEDGISIEREADKHSSSSILTNFKYLFSPYDISKAKYRLCLYNCGVDTMCYTVSYTDMVRFSASSTDSYEISENSISYYSYVSDDYSDELSMHFGVQYYVDFLEATNIQNIRIIILTALLALPLGLVVKNGWALLISTGDKTNTSTRRRKKIKRKKYKKK